MDIWHIVGNGPGEQVVGENERVIRFNQPLTLNAGTNLTITNSKVAGLKNGFLVQGELPDEQFIERLEINSKKLEPLLGCKPSLGILTIKTMLEYDVVVNVSCMALLPSLERPKGYPENKAIPAAYHNWLAERQLALLWIDKLCWPEFLLQAPVQNGASTTITMDCFHLLKQLPSLSRKEASQLWEKLSKVSYHTWLEQADGFSLKTVEPLFYIPRDRHISPNWWMYDNQVSVHVNHLQKILALVQQAYIFSKRVKA
ncbi:hypothetical protein P7F88_17705 [Vibrio hannami]|uniref:hypothetical protein n=1 Tax=Vibrio hannami TaxID=2717094 RepID=UPI002410B087|nr:hypothetical protein [Vibrio hannami]MDG3087803.1 hypothetical protein [Vibrio hannami]